MVINGDQWGLEAPPISPTILGTNDLRTWVQRLGFHGISREAWTPSARTNSQSCAMLDAQCGASLDRRTLPAGRNSVGVVFSV